MPAACQQLTKRGGVAQRWALGLRQPGRQLAVRPLVHLLQAQKSAILQSTSSAPWLTNARVVDVKVALGILQTGLPLAGGSPDTWHPCCCHSQASPLPAGGDRRWAAHPGIRPGLRTRPGPSPACRHSHCLRKAPRSSRNTRSLLDCRLASQAPPISRPVVSAEVAATCRGVQLLHQQEGKSLQLLHHLINIAVMCNQQGIQQAFD